MINLIPPTAQIQVQREYWIRAVSVWLLLCGSAFLIVALLYIPTYVLIQAQLKTHQQEYSEVTNEAEQYTDAEAAILHSNDIATLLTSEKKEVLFSFVIGEIEKSAHAGIAISSFTLSRADQVLSSITITGQADTRASLSQFRDTLESNALFKTATLPLSNLAKDKEIPFSITVTPRIQKQTSS